MKNEPGGCVNPPGYAQRTIDLVVIDSLARFYPGGSENEATVTPGISMTRRRISRARRMSDSAIVSTAAAVSQQHGLLSGDALVVATMRHFNISHLVSHDADFDRVPELARFAPV